MVIPFELGGGTRVGVVGVGAVVGVDVDDVDFVEAFFCFRGGSCLTGVVHLRSFLYCASSSSVGLPFSSTRNLRPLSLKSILLMILMSIGLFGGSWMIVGHSLAFIPVDSTSNC